MLSLPSVSSTCFIGIDFTVRQVLLDCDLPADPRAVGARAAVDAGRLQDLRRGVPHARTPLRTLKHRPQRRKVHVSAFARFYTLRRPVMGEVLSTRIWGAPPAGGPLL